MSFSFGSKKRGADDDEEPSTKKQAPAFSFGGGTGGFKFGGGGGGASTGGFAFGASASGSSSGGAAAGLGASTGGGFKFGGAASTAPASTGGGFAFGGSAAAASTGSFSFGGASSGGGSFAFGGAAAGTGGGFSIKAPVAKPASDEEEEDNAPVADQEPDIAKSAESETVLEEHIAVLMTLTDVKKNLEERLEQAAGGGTEADKKQAQDALDAAAKSNFKEWKKRGKSTLKLLEVKDSGKRMLRMRSENGQQLLLNDWCSSSKASVQGKNKITLTTATGTNHMIQVKPDVRDALLAAIQSTTGGKGEPGGNVSAGDEPAKPKAAAVETAAQSMPMPAKSLLPAPAAAAAAIKASGSSTFQMSSKSSLPSSSSSSSSSSSVAAGAGAAAQPMHQLNRSFAEWIKEAVRKDPACDLSPCLADYLQHVQKISTSN